MCGGWGVDRGIGGPSKGLLGEERARAKGIGLRDGKGSRRREARIGWSVAGFRGGGREGNRGKRVGRWVGGWVGSRVDAVSGESGSKLSKCELYDPPKGQCSEPPPHEPPWVPRPPPIWMRSGNGMPTWALACLPMECELYFQQLLLQVWLNFWWLSSD